MGRHGAGGGGGGPVHNPGSIHDNDRGEYMGGGGMDHNPNGPIAGHGHGGDASLIPMEYLCPMSSTLMFDPVTGTTLTNPN